MIALIEQVVTGDARAWHRLWESIQPTLWAITGKWQVAGPLSQRDDDRKNIILSVMDRLRTDDFRRLRSYLESASRRGSPSSFKTWLATVTARVAIDYVRAHPEYRDLRRKSNSERWIRVVPLSDQLPDQTVGDPASLATASIMMDRARTDLRREQLAALCFWLQGDDTSRIAERLSLPGPHDAQLLVRSALKRLRDHYEKAPASQATDKEGLT